MAHLTCVTHGRRSLVTHAWNDPTPTGQVILHRGDREPCSGRLKFGKVEFSPMVALQGNLREVLAAGETIIVKATPREWRPSKTRRPRRR